MTRKAWNKGLTGLPPNRKPEGEHRDCVTCGAQFYVQKSRYMGATAKYCSRKCYADGRWSVGGACLGCGSPTRSRYCSKTCQVKVNARRKQEAYWAEKIKIMDSLGGACRSCGETDHRVLEINHIDQEAKTRPPKNQWSWSRRLKDWRENAANLEILCANCHRKHTWEQCGWGVGRRVEEAVRQPRLDLEPAPKAVQERMDI